MGAGRGCHTKHFVEASRALGVTPHVAQKKRYNAIDGRTTSWEGYGISQRRRKIVEESFGWMKTVGGLRKLRHRGERKVRVIFTFTASVFNLVRLRNLGAERPLMATGEAVRGGIAAPGALPHSFLSLSSTGSLSGESFSAAC